jgi:hypothetical protein
MAATNSSQLGGGGASIAPPTLATNPGGSSTNGTSAAGGGNTGVLSPPTPSNPSLSSLYPTAPVTGTFSAVNGTASLAGTATAAVASDVGNQASISTGSMNPNDSTNAASQLNSITSTNSPYMQLARKQGMLSAAQRGLGNSSIAAGASEAAATAAAAPLAQQNASAASQGQMQNSQLNTQVSDFNAGEQSANQQLDAQLQTQTSQANAEQQQSAGATNAAALNVMKQQTQQIIAQMNTQFLSGSQAQTLAGIQGQYSELIAQNQSAAALTQSALNGIASAMANPQINASQSAQAISVETTLLNSALGMINVLNGGNPTALPNVSNVTSVHNAPAPPTTVPGLGGPH